MTLARLGGAGHTCVVWVLSLQHTHLWEPATCTQPGSSGRWRELISRRLPHSGGKQAAPGHGNQEQSCLFIYYFLLLASTRAHTQLGQCTASSRNKPLCSWNASSLDSDSGQHLLLMHSSFNKTPGQGRGAGVSSQTHNTPGPGQGQTLEQPGMWQMGDGTFQKDTGAGRGQGRGH